jgi:hypothetical protein
MEQREIKLPFMEPNIGDQPYLDTIPEQKTSTKIPDYILPTAEYLLSGVFDPLRDPLTRPELESAIKHRIVKYPATVRTINDDPPTNQQNGLITFMLFKEPKKTASGKPVYGYFKLRGNDSSEKDCTARAVQIVKEVDSKLVNRIASVGKWHVICEDDIFVMDKLDVNTNPTEENEAKQLRDETVKEKEAQQRKIQREIREREEECKNGGDIYDNKESITYYTMRRVTDMRLTEAVESVLKVLARHTQTRNECRKELKELEMKFPNFKDEWLDCYNAERAKTRIPPFIPSTDKFKDYDSWTIEDNTSDSKE